MIHLIWLIQLLAFSEKPVNLLQEQKKVLCSNSSTNVLIDHRDRFFDVNGTRYNLHEFLDKAILAQSSNRDWALLHLTRPNKALLIRGQILNLKESFCKQVEASKHCTTGQEEGLILWSPSQLTYQNNQKSLQLSLVHYGVYPNDGTYFIAHDEDNGIALIDYGANFQVLHGIKENLDCSYHNQ